MLGTADRLIEDAEVVTEIDGIEALAEGLVKCATIDLRCVVGSVTVIGTDKGCARE